MKRVAVFGGAFDPPHYGHLHVAIALQEWHQIDVVYVIPSYQSADRDHQFSPHQRLAMTQLAFAGVPGCRVLPIEMDRKGISYTIDTVDQLIDEDSDFRAAEKYLFLGADAAMGLHRWKEYRRLLSLVQPLVAARSPLAGMLFENTPREVVNHIDRGWTDVGLFDISSTMIRERLRQCKYVEHVVPKAVVDYLRGA